MITIGFIPIDDHFRVIVAITPKGMRVEIALPPGGRLGPERSVAPEQQQQCDCKGRTKQAYHYVFRRVESVLLHGP